MLTLNKNPESEKISRTNKYYFYNELLICTEKFCFMRKIIAKIQKAESKKDESEGKNAGRASL